MNVTSLGPCLRLVLAASIGVLGVVGPIAIAGATGCTVPDDDFPNCSDLYVDPSPQCPDMITADSMIDAYTLDTTGLSEATPVSCEVLVIRWIQQTENGPCFQLPEKSLGVNYSTPSGGPCPE